MHRPHRLTLVSMSGLRVGHQALLQAGMRLPGLSKRAAALSQLPPLGLLTLGGLVGEDWDVQLIQDDGVSSIDSATETIVAGEPDLVAFSSLTPAIDRAASISQQLCQRQIPTVIGGLHATAAPESCRPYFDVVVRGDGEATFVQLIDDFVQNRLQREYRSDGSFDINAAPLPRWALLGQQIPPRYTLQTQRGCPWACSFCAASRLLGPARAKSVARIRAELAEILKRQHRPWIELADDNTFATERDAAPMLDAFQEAGARWFTESDWRIAEHPQLLAHIARSGCRQILIGVESSVFRYRGMGRKSASLERITEACVSIQEAGIVVNACLIVGAEGETPASIERLGDFLQDAPFGELQLTLQTPFPGTTLYNTLKAEQRLIDENFSRYTLFDVVFQPDQMSPIELQDRFNALIERTFSAHSQRRRDAICKQIRLNQRKQI